MKKTEEAIGMGFLEHYALAGKTLEPTDNPEPPESRTLIEIRQIVECVRVGIPIEVDYYGGEMDDDPYVSRRYW